MADMSLVNQIFLPYNWTGNGEWIDISGNVVDVLPLPTTALTAQNGEYTIRYSYLFSAAELLASGYWDATDAIAVNFVPFTVGQALGANIVMHRDSQFNYDYSVFYSDVTNISFAPADSADAEILFGQNTLESPLYASADNPADEGGRAFRFNPIEGQSDEQRQIAEQQNGDIFFNEGYKFGWDNSTQLGGAQLFAIMHEIGHAMGLAHPTEGGAIDSQKYTIMSKEFAPQMDDVSDPPFPFEEQDVYASGLQLYDILALQEIFNSRNYETRSLANSYGLSEMSLSPNLDPDDPFLYTIWDGGGIDQIDASAFNEGAEIDLRQSRFSSIGDGAPNIISGVNPDIKKDAEASAVDPVSTPV